jgi:hypothetical protein
MFSAKSSMGRLIFIFYASSIFGKLCKKSILFYHIVFVITSRSNKNSSLSFYFPAHILIL